MKRAIAEGAFQRLEGGALVGVERLPPGRLRRVPSPSSTSATRGGARRVSAVASEQRREAPLQGGGVVVGDPAAEPRSSRSAQPRSGIPAIRADAEGGLLGLEVEHRSEDPAGPRHDHAEAGLELLLVGQLVDEGLAIREGDGNGDSNQEPSLGGCTRRRSICSAPDRRVLPAPTIGAWFESPFPSPSLIARPSSTSCPTRRSSRRPPRDRARGTPPGPRTGARPRAQAALLPRPPDRRIAEPRLVLTEELLGLCRWIADYYAATLGEVLHAAAPSPTALTRRAPRSADVDEGGWHASEPPRREALNSDQGAALEALEGALGDRAFHPFLLYGVTGGQDAVYLHSRARSVRRGGQASSSSRRSPLSPSADAFRRSRAPEGRALSSTLRPGSGPRCGGRWRGELDLVVGTRSAGPLAVSDLRFLVVDEEQTGYKQEDSPRYTRRRGVVARAAARPRHRPLLGQPSLRATPGQRGLIPSFSLPLRVDGRPLRPFGRPI